MLKRREFLSNATQLALIGWAGLGGAVKAADQVELPFGNGVRALVRYPQKRPLIQMTARPPQLETPFAIFDEGLITPNDAFFVRYHLAGLPEAIDPDLFRLTIGGKVDRPVSLSLADIKQFDAVELVAAAQCSGNSRGFFEPRVAGGQLANGAMGNARWRGVPLKTLLDAAGVQPGSRQVTFRGLDQPVEPETPAFVKALDIDQARDGEVMVAYAMNGEDLPFLNGYPLRLVVPGHYATYWLKHLNQITVIDQQFDGFWMKTAYRIPANGCSCSEPGKPVPATMPIGRFNVRSFITSHGDGAKVKAGREVTLRGFAFDGGYGITEVLLSVDQGQSWLPARLSEDLGRYSFRGWQTKITLPRGDHALKIRAINRIGQSQPLEPLWNPSGYMRNVVETTHLQAV